ncbi:hypothetical protein R3P38DRAFT_2718575, partial [Favolaschia claudopus]
QRCVPLSPSLHRSHIQAADFWLISFIPYLLFLTLGGFDCIPLRHKQNLDQ